jgi:hemoglobin-like flavoprotein
MIEVEVMTPESVHLLRKSFQRIEAHGHVAALAFYRRLFEIDPTLRPLFRTDIEAQAGKLIEMLSVALAMLEKPGQLRATLEELGARHVGYGVKDEHYATVRMALIDMLGTVLGDGFTPTLRAAWSDVLNAISEMMLAGTAKQMAMAHV